MEILKKPVDCNPDVPILFFVLGSCAHQMGDVSVAFVYYTRALEVR